MTGAATALGAAKRANSKAMRVIGFMFMRNRCENPQDDLNAKTRPLDRAALPSPKPCICLGAAPGEPTPLLARVRRARLPHHPRGAELCHAVSAVHRFKQPPDRLRVPL